MDGDDIKKKFWEMRAKADHEAELRDRKEAFEQWKKNVVTQRTREAKDKRILSAIAGADLDNRLSLSNVFVPEHKVRNRPGEKLVTGKVKGKRRRMNKGMSMQ